MLTRALDKMMASLHATQAKDELEELQRQAKTHTQQKKTAKKWNLLILSFMASSTFSLKFRFSTSGGVRYMILLLDMPSNRSSNFCCVYIITAYTDMVLYVMTLHTCKGNYSSPTQHGFDDWMLTQAEARRRSTRAAPRGVLHGGGRRSF